MESLKNEVITVICDTCAPDEPNVEDHDRPLLESGMDSLDFASVLMALEDKFEVSLLVEDGVDEVQSINMIVAQIEKMREV